MWPFVRRGQSLRRALQVKPGVRRVIVGFHISWVAFSGITPDAGLSRLGLRRVGRQAGYATEPFTGSVLPNGWFLVVADRDIESPIISTSSLGGLSEAAEVIACSVAEGVMASTAEFWRDGHRMWSLSHDAQTSARHLESSGALPSGYQDVLAQETARQDSEDPDGGDVDFFFDIPLAVARTIAGFKHDEKNPGLDDEGFEVFEWIHPPAPRRRWWQFWK